LPKEEDATGFDEVDLRAKKKIIADELIGEMERRKVTRSTLAKRIQTSRT